MEKIRAVVFIGMNPWDYSEINDSVRFLAAACAGTKADCLYVEPPGGLRGALHNPASLLGDLRWRRQNRPGITLYTPPFGFAPVGLGLRKRADNLTAAGFSRLLEEIYGPAWREQTLVYISSWSYTQTYFVKRLKPKYLVFHILDDSFAFPEIKNDSRVLAGNKLFYQQMMAGSSLVIAVSQSLAEKYAALYRREVQVLKNGVNVAHFNLMEDAAAPAPEATAAAAAEMTGLSEPVLMYTGSLNSWIDLPLLIKLAEDRPAYSLVLIGHHYESSTDTDLWRQLMDKPNVHWLKSKPYALLPGYLRRAAALLLPRTADEHSLASDPLKLYEYLSTGKPVISTALPALGDFREFVHVAGSEDFAGVVDAALQKQNAGIARRQIAMMEKHSWPARIKELSGLLAAKCGVSL